MIDGSGYSLSTDVWSLGVSVIALCEGNVPHYREANPRKAITLISHSPPPQLTAGRREKEWSPELTDFLQSCLQKEPSKRKSISALLSHPWVAAAVDELTASSGSSRELRNLFSMREEWMAAAHDRMRRQQEAERREELRLQRERAEEEARLAAEEKARVRRAVEEMAANRLRVFQESVRRERMSELRSGEEMAAEETATRSFLRREEEWLQESIRGREAAERELMYVEDELSYTEQWRHDLADLYHGGWVCKQSEFLGMWNPRFFTVRDGLVRYFDSGEEDSAKEERGSFVLSPLSRVSVPSPRCLQVDDAKSDGTSWTFSIRCADEEDLEAWRTHILRNVLLIDHRLKLSPFQERRAEEHYREGWMEKQSEYLGSWNRRFFVIDKGVIRYFDGETADERREERGRYALSFASDLEWESTDDVDVPDGGMVVQNVNVYTGERWALLLRCEDDDERQLWIECIEYHMSLFVRM